jgi:hypothetical protein
MKPLFRRAALFLTILALCMPIGLMLVFLLFPLWSWLEAAWKIEAVGPSGPAPWVYAAVYVVLVTVSTLALWIGNRRRDRLSSQLSSQR